VNTTPEPARPELERPEPARATQAAATGATRSFQDKWRAQWPEWALAEVFMPASQRDVAVAWFALMQEFGDAAWGGSDPAPGLAKLAWWQEELRGWAKGARRHPLGEVLQPQAAPWGTLADAMGVLRHRELPADAAAARDALRGLEAAIALVEAGLFARPAGATATALAMLAPAALGQGGSAHAESLLKGVRTLPRSPARPVRLLGVLLALRLARAMRDGSWQPAGRWRSLWALWRAARN
jgi:hypothetical protein